MSLALLARSHPDIMDVGLHDLIPDLIGPGSEWLELKDPQLCPAMTMYPRGLCSKVVQSHEGLGCFGYLQAFMLHFTGILGSLLLVLTCAGRLRLCTVHA